MENNSTPVPVSEERKPTQVWNRDINTLASVLYAMQDILRIEDMQQWQQDRMINISARLEGSSGGSGTAKGLDEEEDDKKTGRYIRRERYAGACERSFYVGEDVTQEDIKGEYKHGILKLFVPKKEAKPVSNDPKYITIE